MSEEPRILGFFCHWCCYAAADAAGVGRLQYPSNVRVIRIMCAGRLDPAFVLEGFLNGADGIIGGGWHLGECHYRSGNFEAMNRAALLRMTIETLGINSDRFSLNWVSAAEATRFVQVITDFTSRIRDLGPLGKEEGLHRETLSRKIEAARMALEGSRMRMAFARQAKQIKNEGTHGELMSEEKLNATLKDEINLYETYIFLREKERSAEELAALMDLPADHVSSYVDKLRKKKIWDGTLVQTEQP